jgi:hypothetical protein
LVTAQTGNFWPPQRNIPLYHPETDPPYLIADQNRTVHAFSSQFIDDMDIQAIYYNKWNPDIGWTVPVDVILPPLKTQARILGAYLDQAGVAHVVFFSGDETAAQVYYSQARAVMADRAQAWSRPVMVGEKALIPENGTIAGDGGSNLVIVYSGEQLGHGFYAVYSADGGITWTDPLPIFLTGHDQLWPFFLNVYVADTGQLFAVWSVQDRDNHGQATYFASFKFADQQWSEPEILAENRGNLGTSRPSIIEYRNTLFVMYYDGFTNQQYLRRSSDLGETWTTAFAPFPHIGSNGPVSFVVDSNEDLHIFWAQRVQVPQQPAVHGVWHSVWNDQSETWGPYEPIVRGEKVLDRVGYTSFDPTSARAVVSQGNVLLIVWRTDPGSKGNGVWYTYDVLDTPELPVFPLPTPASNSSHTVETTDVISQPTPASTPKPFLADVDVYRGERLNQNGNPARVIATAIIPVSVLILAIFFLRRIYRFSSRSKF